MTGRGLGWWAALGHRVSGVALAAFLPLHFLTLGLALEGAEGLDRFLALAEAPLVKAAEWGLVILLSLHLTFGLRLLAIELLPWRGPGALRLPWIWGGAAISAAAGFAFLWVA